MGYQRLIELIRGLRSMLNQLDYELRECGGGCEKCIPHNMFYNPLGISCILKKN